MVRVRASLFFVGLALAGCGRLGYELISLEGPESDASAPDAATLADAQVPDAAITRDGAVDLDACVPSTDCDTRCGIVDDGCGGTIDCGACDMVQLSVTATGTGITLGPDFVSSTPAGIDGCMTAFSPGTTCTAFFPRGQLVTLTLVAAGSDNHTWLEDGAACSGPTCDVTMDVERSVAVVVLRL